MNLISFWNCERSLWILLMLHVQLIVTLNEWNGKWCPKVQTRMVTCRQPRWDWNQDRRGSQGPMRKYYTVVYRKQKEIKWRCCPGFQGEHCDLECFNCTTIQELKSRLSNTEGIVRKLTYLRQGGKDENSQPTPSRCSCQSGEKGERGDRGVSGIPGRPGTTGPPGPRGPKGETGKSTTAPQAIMAGKMGPPGIPGLRGDPGKIGMKGERGRTGAKGKPGEAVVVNNDIIKDNTIAFFEERLQLLESRISKLEDKLNKTEERKENYEVLEARVVLLEEIFPKLSAFKTRDIEESDEGEVTQIKELSSDCECSKPPALPTFPTEIANYLIRNNRTTNCNSLSLAVSKYLNLSLVDNAESYTQHDLPVLNIHDSIQLKQQSVSSRTSIAHDNYFTNGVLICVLSLLHLIEL